MPLDAAMVAGTCERGVRNTITIIIFIPIFVLLLLIVLAVDLLIVDAVCLLLLLSMLVAAAVFVRLVASWDILGLASSHVLSERLIYHLYILL